MNISVEYKDTSGTISQRNYNLTRLAFTKHLAIAGQGYAPRLHKLFKTLGMFFHYSYYLQRQSFYNNRFSEPPTTLSDPTEKGQFSNLVGKAIADFLSKNIDNSFFTVNYEAVMRLLGQRVRGQRPDLVAFSPTAMFAIEAKGRHQSSPGNMTTHKTQAQSGTVPVNFSVACVSYNLFNRVTCKYHDPYNDNIPYDNVTLRAATRNYYKGLSEFMTQKYFEYQQFELQGESFYEIELSPRNYEKIFPEEFPFYRPFWFFEVFDYYRPRLILPTKVSEFAQNGISNETKPFVFEAKQDNYTYIDKDRVGLRIRK